MIDSEDYPLMTVGELARAQRAARIRLHTRHRIGWDLPASAGCGWARFREVRTRRAAALPTERPFRSSVRISASPRSLQVILGSLVLAVERHIYRAVGTVVAPMTAIQGSRVG
jgi:hypothetical protein